MNKAQDYDSAFFTIMSNIQSLIADVVIDQPPFYHDHYGLWANAIELFDLPYTFIQIDLI